MPGIIRRATSDDLDAIFSIESAAYEFPWTRGIFADCLRVGYTGLVYQLEDSVRGYAFLSVAAGEGHILNVCVDPLHQGRGIGGQLMGGIIDAARSRQAATLFLEVRASNNHARELYHKWGFNEIGLRKNYYPARQGREDAVVLARQFVEMD